MRIIEGAYNKGFKYYAESPSPSFWNLYLMDGGLLVLSRFPIAKINFRSFEVGCFPDDLCDKGVLHTQINIEGSLVNFFTTHS